MSLVFLGTVSPDGFFSVINWPGRGSGGPECEVTKPFNKAPREASIACPPESVWGHLDKEVTYREHSWPRFLKGAGLSC